jgi:hypothetical protein
MLPDLSRSLLRALTALAMLILLSWLVVTATHAGDRYGIGWVQGSWMALAKYANAGVLYPPLYDGHFYGGTRFMPVPVVLHAGAALVTGEYLISGKVVGFLSFFLVLSLTWVVLRKLRCPTPVALALTSLIVVTNTGLMAGTRIQGDALPVFLQLAAASAVAFFNGRRATIGAAALSVLGVLSKMSAVWAPIAIVIWLLARDRRRALSYAITTVGLLVLSVAALQILSGGRMLMNLRDLTFAGVGGVGALRDSPTNLLWQLATFAAAGWALFPLALLGGIVNVGRREAEIFYVSLACEILIMLVVVADEGVTQNHLIDLMVLIVVTGGGLWHRVESDATRQPLMTTAIALVVFWIGATSFAIVLYPEAKAALKAMFRHQADPELDADVVAGHIGPNEIILSEDPYVPVSLGQLPIVLDAWMLRRLGQRHPEWSESLVRRVEAREFDRVVLTRSLEGNDYWYRNVHFGRAIADAIRRHYRFSEQVANYYLYVPTDTK